MFDVMEPPAAASPGARCEGPARLAAHTTAPTHWFVQMLDHIDYGTFLVDADGNVVHANRAAWERVAADHPLVLSRGRLGARRPEDTAALRDALAAASDRGLRKLLVLGRPGARVGVAVVPLPKAYDDTRCATMVLLGKRAVCETLSVQWYAQTHGLTRAESAVLGLLYSGMPAGRIAAHLGVAVSTVRTQIGSIRSKAGVRSVGTLIQHMATLPPLVGVMHSRSVDPGLNFAFD